MAEVAKCVHTTRKKTRSAGVGMAPASHQLGHDAPVEGTVNSHRSHYTLLPTYFSIKGHNLLKVVKGKVVKRKR
jgi:hypothetical protein